jgi:hypothetical protein
MCHIYRGDSDVTVIAAYLDTMYKKCGKISFLFKYNSIDSRKISLIFSSQLTKTEIIMLISSLCFKVTDSREQSAHRNMIACILADLSVRLKVLLFIPTALNMIQAHYDAIDTLQNCTRGMMYADCVEC